MHLGAPVRGLGALSEEWATRLQTAIPEAYDRVIETALAREVDFVILAGDIFDTSSSSYCDYLRFFEGLDKLHAAGIPTYLIAGNHDPYTSWVRNIVRLPESAHMLGIGVPTFELYERDGEPLCLIGGRSYYGQAWPLDEGVADGITRENAIGALSEAHPNAAEAPFSIGIIHAGLDIDASKAVIDESALLSQDIDYWACGHLHRHVVKPIVDDPRIVFPGCVQGTAIREAGERGCYLVELEEGVSPKLEFVPTASVAFHSLDVDISECRTLSDVEKLVKVELFRENGYDYCSEMVARVNLVGTTELHSYLRQPDVIASARRRINDACPSFFCDAVVDCTRFAQAGADDARIEDSPTSQVLQAAEYQRNHESKLIDYVQSTLVQRGIAVPDALARRIGDFRTAAATLACDLVDGRGDGLGMPEARAEVDRRIAACTSRTGLPERSLYRLGDQLESKYLEVRKATEAMAALRQDDRELHELRAVGKDMSEHVAELTDEVEDLEKCRGQLEALDVQLNERRSELARLRANALDLTVLVDNEPSVDPRLLGLTTQDDRAIRDKLEEYAVERERVGRAVDEAKERSATSTAAYEALREIDENEAHAARRGTRTVQGIVSVLLPVVFIVAGVPLFAHGRQINSLSFTVFGIGLVVLAFFLAAAALVVLLRPNKDAEALDGKRKDAHWVMLQDKKLLDARMAEKDELDAELQALFDRVGLHAANGSIRQAQLLLDDAQVERTRMAEQRQRAMAHEMHESMATKALDDLESQRRLVEDAAGLDRDASVRSVEATLREKTQERDELSHRLDDAEARIGELEHTLELARDDRSFDRLKLDYHQIRARLRIAKHDYIVLLLAQQLLAER